MTKIKMRHPTMRFNFTPPGEVFETTPECVDYLISEYGCEVVEEVHVRSPITLDPGEEAVVTTTNSTDEDIVEWVQSPPTETSPGWWEYECKKYRRSKLPAEAKALLE